MEEEMTEQARTAVEIMDNLNDYHGIDKYETAKQFVKDKGFVSESFLDRLKYEYKRIKQRDGKVE